MVHALAPQFPFTGGGTLAAYRPSGVERYFAVAPGIEVSVEPGEDLGFGGEAEGSVYDRQGRLSSPQRKGIWIDSYR